MGNVQRIQPLGWFLTSTGFFGAAAEVFMILFVLSIRYSRSRTQDLHFFSRAYWLELALDLRAFVLACGLYSLHLFIFAIMIALLIFYGARGYILSFTYLLTRPFLGPLLLRALNIIYLALLCHAVFVYDITTLFWLLFTFAYSSTYYSPAVKTGSRRWDRLRKIHWLWDDFERYFDFKLVGPGQLQADRTYLFGFHPHGIYPYSIVWGALSRQWRQKYPGVEMDGLGASVLLAIPFLRDVGMWLGGRDVSREAIVHALSHQRSVCLVPGGQAEMRESRSNLPEIAIVTRHKGFIRLAIQQGVDLVPIFSFGEHDLFDNVYLPKVQKWFLYRVGFGYPHFPYGRWFLPFPRARPITMAIGEPIPVQQNPDPTPEEIDRIHAQYYDALQKLFDQYKVEAGYGHCKLALVE
eukprot:TRINITY_DN17439_c0_g1_i1.p1 TRINITY_DN17439_c0_g1~~TRINITY_DN17439_c0_g1_i1.p1  ORF type:complete len:409 (-),score=58.41 TRINITY_DN17439_c0_g1_i1:87-1313(-)